MRKNISEIALLLFLGLTITFQITYCIRWRNMISNVGMFRFPTASGGAIHSGTSPRDVTDHFVCCVGLLHYFLSGYLYSVKKHFAEKKCNGKNGKVNCWAGVEIFCQFGIFFSYLFTWIDNCILSIINEWCHFCEQLHYWDAGNGAQVIYMLFCKKQMIPIKSTWPEQYGNIFSLLCVIAPILLMLLIYSIHFVFRFMQLKRNNGFHMIWAVWTVVFSLAVAVLAVWAFPQISYNGVWPWQQSLVA